MNKYTKDTIANQIKYFYKNTGYVPSTYDVLFHNDVMTSINTIRKYYGSWAEAITSIFGNNIPVTNKLFRMSYGGYGNLYKISSTISATPNTLTNAGTFELYGSNYKNIHIGAKRLYVIYDRVYYLFEAIIEGGYEVIDTYPIDTYYYTYGIKIRDTDRNLEYVVSTLDFPIISNYYKRTLEWLLDRNLEGIRVIDCNGVVKNHLRSHITKLVNQYGDEYDEKA